MSSYRYISTGLGHGNAYGLAAVCAVVFPIMYFGRLYWPGGCRILKPRSSTFADYLQVHL
jgi:hypothetical protein